MTSAPRIRRLSVLVASVLVLVLAPAASAQSTASPFTTIGVSQAGEPLDVFHLGSGRARVLVLGGQHGGPEVNTVRLVRALLAFFQENPSDIPAGVSLDILPVGNPDGVAYGTRLFRSGVDPNRNWGGAEWQTDAWDSNAAFRLGLGGPEPFSEPETRALAEYVLRTRPALVVNYHSAGAFMFGSGDIGQAYEDGSGYWRPGGGAPGPGGRTSSPLSYRATGSMNAWLRQNGIDNILVELATPSSIELERNLAGLKAALALVASQTAFQAPVY